MTDKKPKKEKPTKWTKIWEDTTERPCKVCKFYWGDGAGCDKLDCIHRPDQSQTNHFARGLRIND